MNKCPKCGEVFDGNFCPKCGSPALIEKFCPKCGVKLDGAETICRQCGYSFLAPPQPLQFYQPVAVQAVTKKSPLKKALCILLPLILIITTLILVFTLVDIKNNGTYYAVQNGEVNRKSFITIKNGDWSDEDGNGGEYKKSNGKLTFYIDFFGETMEYATGEVNDGMLTIDMGGFDAVYISKKHKHNYGEVKETVQATCLTDGFEIHECKCGCINQITTTPKLSHEAQGGWYFDDTSHWQICRRCNNIINEAEHGDGNTCAVCGYPKIDTEGLSYNLNSNGTSYSVSGIGSVTNTIIRIPARYNNLPVTSIGDGAFKSCRSLKGIIIPDSITSIGDWAFEYCDSLTSITIGNGVTTIGSSAFSRCSSLTSITIPYGVITIGEYAFYECRSIESITIPYGIIAIGDSTFNGCQSLESITIPDSVTTISDGAFGWCSSLESVTIGKGVTSIGSSAFYKCSSLTSITIPDGVTTIGSSAFEYCSSLESITVASGNTKYHNSGNCLIETESKKLVVGCKNSIIPADGSVTTIGSSAFYYCDSLTSITIPDSITEIDQYAFSGCSSLTSVTIGNGVTSIGKYAFFNCCALTSVIIPASVTSIGVWAFYDCTSLTSINYNGTKEQWNAIRKGSSWNYATGNYTVHCTDGDIAKQ